MRPMHGIVRTLSPGCNNPAHASSRHSQKHKAPLLAVTALPPLVYFASPMRCAVVFALTVDSWKQVGERLHQI
eukprot:9433925-Pyramimonas_sp.AAC.1